MRNKWGNPYDCPQLSALRNFNATAKVGKCKQSAVSQSQKEGAGNLESAQGRKWEERTAEKALQRSVQVPPWVFRQHWVHEGEEITLEPPETNKRKNLCGSNSAKNSCCSHKPEWKNLIIQGASRRVLKSVLPR